MIDMYDIVLVNNEYDEMDVGIVVAIQHKAGYSQALYQIRNTWYSRDAIKRVLGNAQDLKAEIDLESEQ